MRRIVPFLLFLALLPGCMVPWGMNMQTEQTRKLEESQASKTVAESSTELKGPAPVVVTQGEGSTANIAPPAQTELKHTSKKAAGLKAGLESKETAEGKQTNPWTMFLYGAGLILVVIGLKKLWDLIKNTSIGKAAEAGDAAGKAIIDSIKSQLQNATDPTVIAATNASIVAAEAKRDEVYAATKNGATA